MRPELRGRDQSKHCDRCPRGSGHFDFTEPFNDVLCGQLAAAVEQAGLDEALVSSGCYGVTQGPRFETAAEIRRMARDGCDIVGMTLMPEASLAKQANLKYAALCPVVNKAAGCGDGAVEIDEILEFLASFELLLTKIATEIANLR